MKETEDDADGKTEHVGLEELILLKHHMISLMSGI